MCSSLCPSLGRPGFGDSSGRTRGRRRDPCLCAAWFMPTPLCCSVASELQARVLLPLRFHAEGAAGIGGASVPGGPTGTARPLWPLCLTLRPWALLSLEFEGRRSAARWPRGGHTNPRSWPSGSWPLPGGAQSAQGLVLRSDARGQGPAQEVCAVTVPEAGGGSHPGLTARSRQVW